MAQEKFSEYLRRKRRELGDSQEDLADTVGLSANYIAKLETGVSQPGVKALMRLAMGLRVSRDEIMSVFMQSMPEPPADIDQVMTEFHEFPERLQTILVEIGFLIQKYNQKSA